MESKSRVSPSSRYTASVVAYVSNPRMAAKSIPKRVSVPIARRYLGYTIASTRDICRAVKWVGRSRIEADGSRPIRNRYSLWVL